MLNLLHLPSRVLRDTTEYVADRDDIDSAEALRRSRTGARVPPFEARRASPTDTTRASDKASSLIDDVSGGTCFRFICSLDPHRYPTFKLPLLTPPPAFYALPFEDDTTDFFCIFPLPTTFISNPCPLSRSVSATPWTERVDDLGLRRPSGHAASLEEWSSESTIAGAACEFICLAQAQRYRRRSSRLRPQ
jgi:hypothetical protein